MIRKIITINETKCNGCGLCTAACHEGAIALVDGKAKLLRDDYCDGLGDCLPTCPTNAISFEEREAAAFDKAAVKIHLSEKNSPTDPMSGQLSQWPIQIKLVPVNAPYFQDANLLIAADCTAFTYGNFHQEFIKNHITLIGCPKLDDADYHHKLEEILRHNSIQNITVIRMEVPCCKGMELAARTALANSEKAIPLKIVTISTDGRILGSELYHQGGKNNG